jgi:integrase
MASLTYHDSTRRGYQLRAYDAADSTRRHSIWLGDIPAREAETIKRHVEAVIESQQLGTPMPGETLRWLAKVQPKLRGKLSGILGTARSVREAVTAYTKYCEQTHKRTTCDSIAQSLDRFTEEFGRMQMRSLVGEEIDTWIHRRNVGKNTTAKIAKHLKTFFRWAKRQNWIDELVITATSSVGVGDKQFVRIDDFQALIDSFAAECVETQAALGILRWAGLRPGELFLLTRSSVDWDRKRFWAIDAKRTKRSSRGPPVVRETPLFPELVPYLESVWPLSELPTDPLLPRLVAQGFASFDARVRVARGKLGMDWPRLFTSLRATRETELIARSGLKAACSWIGNSPTVALKHYEQITSETWNEATGE